MIVEGDGEANYAHYALHKLHLLPSQLLAIPRRERAFVYASISLQVEEEKRRTEEARRAGAGRGRRRK
ncbi:hypothetical protein [Symbiobacterium terraclitae]|uniref:hypothetical protein n=1 Tax=Symbiobacterium terraclitae TaxID=557451 RepID=UPI0035B5303E